MFNNNVGAVDRVARVVLGVVLIAFALGYLAPGASYRWIGWIGVVPLLTAVFGTCPLYSLLGMSTCAVSRPR
jgi:sulfite exporter TauE/SafE